VARAAGLSIASVSRALARPNSVREETRKRVFAAVEALNFQPNQQAADFRRGRSNAIMVLVTDIANPFYSVFFSAIEAEARRNGFTVLIGDTARDPENERSYVAMLRTGKADGLICVGRLPQGLPIRDDGNYAGPPIIACSRGGGLGIPTVRIDNFEAGRIVGRHLAELGHIRLAQIHGSLRYDDYRARYEGFLEGLAERGVPAESVLVYEGDETTDSGRAAVNRLMQDADPPTAIFAHSDEMALGAMHQLGIRGFNVPNEISLVGFDDLNYAAALSPPLTTMRIPRVDWGRQACAHLIEQIVSGGTAEDTVIAAEFVLRSSTAAAPRRKAAPMNA
jgi:LacI family repressor for deo operon, udp, cdd, tsx, nupC, and nupG